MKKWIALCLAVTLIFSASACRRQKQATPLQGSMVENVNRIMEQNPAEFMGAVIPVDLRDTSEEGLWALKSYTGLDTADKITDVAVYEPMTGAQAFSLVLLRVVDAKDAENIARQMKENIDPRKWICVGADQVMAAGYADVVMFIMLNSEMGKTAQSYVDAFANLCGSQPDFTI